MPAGTRQEARKGNSRTERVGPKGRGGIAEQSQPARLLASPSKLRPERKNAAGRGNYTYLISLQVAISEGRRNFYVLKHVQAVGFRILRLRSQTRSLGELPHTVPVLIIL